MKLQLVTYKCATCQNVFQAPSLCGDFLYGQFLMRNPHTGNLRFLNAIEDPEYDNIRLFVKNSPLTTSLDDEGIASTVQKIFELCCDRDVDGDIFQIDGMPPCPVCGKADIEYWEATDPAKYNSIDVPRITHHDWNNMTKKEKEVFLKKELKKITSSLLLN